jgi:hypothetical protein
MSGIMCKYDISLGQFNNIISVYDHRAKTSLKDFKMLDSNIYLCEFLIHSYSKENDELFENICKKSKIIYCIDYCHLSDETVVHSIHIPIKDFFEASSMTYNMMKTPKKGLKDE